MASFYSPQSPGSRYYAPQAYPAFNRQATSNLRFGRHAETHTPEEAETLPPRQPFRLTVKKLLLSIGIITAVAVGGKMMLQKLGGQFAERAKTLNWKTLFSALGKLGIQPFYELFEAIGKMGPAASEFLSSQSGQAALGFAKSDLACKAISGVTLGLGKHLLPERAFEILKQNTTQENIRQLLDADVLKSLINYAAKLYQRSPKTAEGLTPYLTENAERIAEDITRLTGLRKEPLDEFLEALKTS